ncbi:MAG: acyl CoA:acetate/3-ketoacid CoA transferase, partial [Alphaproteobacteria bacterium]
PEQMQNYAVRFDPSLCGETTRPLATIKPDPLSMRRVIARRAAFELSRNAVFNLGVGVSAAIPNVVAEEDMEDLVSLTVEAGVVGGIPGQGLYFGSSVNPKAIMDQGYMFDFYAGGGLDVAFVSFAEVDAEGNVNVTRFGDRNDGAGGFIEITQNAKRVIFSGTLTAGGLTADIADGALNIEREGSIRKFVPRVNQISYNARLGQERGQNTMFITERAVLKMTPDGITVTELAPGVRLQEDVLDRMDFEPRVSPDLGQMDPRIFREGPMGLRQTILERE